MNLRNLSFRPLRYVPMVVGGAAFFAGIAFLFGFFVMLLWNWLMPAIFGLGEITYWQAWGLTLLAHIFFKSDRYRNRPKSRDAEWKSRFRARFEKGLGHKKEEESGDVREDGGDAS